jgi:uncharacterized protein (DUF983 family)
VSPAPAEPTPVARWWRTVVGRAWRGRCPQCGEAPLFERFGRLHPGCTECGLVFRREQGSMTGSMYLTAAITQVVAAGMLLAAFVLTDWSLPVFLAVALPAILVFSYAFWPRSIGLWVAVEYLTDLSNGEDWARPR